MKFFFPGKQEGAIPPKVDRKPNRRRLPRRARVTVWLSLLALLLVSIGPMTDHISVMYEELSLYMDAALDTGQLRYETARSKNSEEQQLDESIGAWRGAGFLGGPADAPHHERTGRYSQQHRTGLAAGR